MKLNQFHKRMDALAKKAEQGAKSITQRAAWAATKTLVMLTPIDTGQAKSNWIVALGTPETEPRAAFTPGKKGSTSGENVLMALAAALSIISRYQQGEIYLTNNLKYIMRLNRGWSSQAPAGFVEAGVESARQSVRGSRILVNFKPFSE